MAAKKRRRKGLARSSSKKTTNEVVDNCKLLRDKPELLIPECIGVCKKCRFDAYKKHLLKVKNIADNPDKLKKFSKRGFQMVRSYAVSLMILHEGNIPIMARFKNELGDFPYVVRGAVKKEYLIGLQHFQDPMARLLAYVGLARKKRINIYSGNGLFCSGLEDNPPEKFVDYMISQFKTTLVKSDDVYTCQHLKKTQVEKEVPDSKPYIIADWHSAGIRLGICKSCLKENMHIYRDISNHIIMSKHGWFSIRAVYKPDCKVDCDSCVFTSSQEGLEDIIDEYKSSKINEMQFIDEWIKRKRELISDKIFINGNCCYGRNSEAFIDSLSPSDTEREALSILFSVINSPIVEENTSANKILTHYWEDYGEKILKEMGYSDNVIEKASSPSEDGGASELLHQVSLINNKEKALAGYPEYSSLEAVPEFVDRIAKSYRYDDASNIVREIDRRVKVNQELKSVGLSFLLVMGRGENRKWQYSSYEYDQGKYLENSAKKLLECKADEYDKYFREYLKMYGYDVKKIP